MLSGDQLRTHHENFGRGFRGYDPSDVMAYLQRLALVFDILGETPGQDPDLPPGFDPNSIRNREFGVIWAGFNRIEVRDYLKQVGNQLEDFLAAPTPPARLELPTDTATIRQAQESGFLAGAAVVAKGRRRPVNLATREGLNAEIARHRPTGEACLIEATIVVADLDEATLRRAVAALEAAGEF